MIGAKLDGETQRKKLISTRQPKQAATCAPVSGACQSKKEKKLKQAATRSIFAPAKARRPKSSSERRRRRRIFITAGEESEANGTCGSNASL